MGFAGLAPSLGRGEVRVSLEGRTLGDLIQSLVRQYGPEAAKALLDEGGGLDPAVQVIRNGQQWLAREDLSAELQEGDSIVFVLLLSGG